ncbi:MAG: RusA family crossover junction endodeoxyribonuclease, partial [Bacteroidales bacterium]|nr:RusA family crossover junction endodeoxyribonuclease [Bacteroidales bacterium]
MEKEIIYGQIVGKANNYMVVPDGNGKRIIKNEKIRAYERNFAKQCKIYANKRISSRFHLFVKVYNTSNRFDLDNALKTLADCLQYVGAITNDNLCTKIVAEKILDVRNPRVEFMIVNE